MAKEDHEAMIDAPAFVDNSSRSAAELAERYLALWNEDGREAVGKDGELFGVGLNFLVLAADGRIERGYTFVG